MNAAIKRALRAAANRSLRIVRKKGYPPPLRGFPNSKHNQGTITIVGYNELFDILRESIESEAELTREQKDALLTFEIFQSKQKGPVTPIDKSAGKLNVEDAFIHSSIDAGALKASEDLGQNFVSLYEHWNLANSGINVHDINYREEWLKLPPNTVRGFPYNNLGKNVDSQILAEVGESFNDALEYFKQCPQCICFTGVRLQGTPGQEPAKVRMVSILPVYYQYLMNGFVHYLMHFVKGFNNFAALNAPEIRDAMIVDALKKAESRGNVILALDFSKFDRCCNEVLRSFAAEAFVYFFGNTNEIKEWREQMKNYSSNQYIMFVIDGVIRPTLVNNLLLSGAADTQITGSIINLAIQIFILRKLGVEDINLDELLALGDDVGISVPKHLVEEGGYKGVMKKIKEIVHEIGFETHDVKAYPEPHLVFLQRLYILQLDLIGIGSYMRTIASMFGKENYSEKIPGIKSIPALELFSQVAMISDVEPNKPKLITFRRRFAKWWLDHDDGLRAVIARTYNDSDSVASNAHRMVSFIIGLTTDDMNHVIDSLKSHAYDRYSIDLKAAEADYSQSFNISVDLIEVWSQHKAWKYPDVKDVFGSDFQLKDSTEEDIFNAVTTEE